MHCHYDDSTIAGQLAKFTDGGDVSTWAKESVAACLKDGIVVGSNATLTPLTNITRAETAVMAEKMLETSVLINK